MLYLLSSESEKILHKNFTMFQIMSLSLLALGRFRSSLNSRNAFFLGPKLPGVVNVMNLNVLNSSGAKINEKQREVLNDKLVDGHLKQLPDPKDALLKDNNPFSVVTGGTKAFFGAFLAACVASILYGAYDSGYRRTLRTSFPWGAQLLDLVMEEEEPSILQQEETHTSAAAAEFRKTFSK